MIETRTADDGAFALPTLDRICQRAFVLATLACRASLEAAPSEPRAMELHAQLQDWLMEEGLHQEFETSEWSRVLAPLGALTVRERIDMSWRSEGLVVLAWALQRVELEPYDQSAEGSAVAGAIGFLEPGAVHDLVRQARRRSEDELMWLADLTLAVHWRLREYSLRTEPMNFVDFAQRCQWAQMPIDDLQILNKDLALRGIPISEASDDVLSECTSIIRERQQAANWLIGQEELYSEVTCDT